MSARNIKITVIVCSNRGSQLGPTVKSILANQGHDLELLIVLQGTETPTDEVRALLDQGRLRIVPDAGRGLSRARNIGIANSAGELVLFTDDDCVVAEDWIEQHARIHEQRPGVALVFGLVEAPAADVTNGGTVPTFDPRSAPEHGRLQGPLVFGMGANMSFKRASLTSIGLFDEAIGAGAPLASGEDVDFALRAAAAGAMVIADHRPLVIHEGGARPQGHASQELWRRDGVGLGAVIAKCVRARDFRGAAFLMRFLSQLNVDALGRLARGGRQSGVRMALTIAAGSAQGAVNSLRWHISREQGVRLAK